MNQNGSNNPNWKGGRCFNSNGYPMIYVPDHPHANNSGYVREHILIAEKALGKFLPKNAYTHHFPSIKKFTHLVICQDHRYHMLLHVRYRALIACGNPNWRPCCLCKKYDDQINLHCNPNGHSYRHRSCDATFARERRLKNR
jgi:hypothetical protein